MSVMKYLLDLITGSRLRELQDKIQKQDDEIEQLCATLDGEEHWMLEYSKPTTEKNGDKECTG